jgi:polysaccharide export outer membrane protein
MCLGGTVVRHLLIVLALCVGAIGLSGCSLPRGAAIASEILSSQDDDAASYSVVSVGKANVADLAKWPHSHTGIHHGWLENHRGPASPVIRSGDRVNLMIWDSQENSLLTSETQKVVDMPGLTVSPSGTIFVPYLDEVVVRGMTPSDARRQIQSALEPIVPSAQVQLSHEAGKQNSVDLVSGVPKPGAYPLLDRNSTILSLIAQGGGISKDLRNPKVRLIRNGKTYETRAEALFSDANRNTVLRGGDTVIVREDDRYFTALGATGTEQLVYFDKDRITVVEALSMIGGLAEGRANLKGVLVLREYPSAALRTDGSGPDRAQVAFTFDLTSAEGLFAARKFQVTPLDTVLATESPVTAARTVLGLIGTTLGVARSVN